MSNTIFPLVLGIVIGYILGKFVKEYADYLNKKENK